MGEYTKNLQLYKVDTVENANDTFNIETMLNDNWDKIDEKLEKLPVQNGGLYINSETTEEDKAEAVEAIKEIGLSASDVGALPVRVVTSGSFNDIKETGAYYISNNVTDKPANTGGLFIVYFYNSEIAHGYYSPNNRNGECPYMCLYNGSWVFRGLLPLDGSVPMSGELTIVSGYAKLGATGDRVEITSKYDDSNSGRIVIGNPKNAEKLENLLKYIFKKDNVENGYRIFGEHNKPSGSYTGNGSATSRQIAANGIGRLGYIFANTSSGYITLAIVWNRCAMIFEAGKAVRVTTYDGCHLEIDGTITVGTTDYALNENGVEYRYGFF